MISIQLYVRRKGDKQPGKENTTTAYVSNMLLGCDNYVLFTGITYLQFFPIYIAYVRKHFKIPILYRLTLVFLKWDVLSF